MDDLISRQAAIDALAEWHDVAITNRLNNLPPAQPSVSKTETVEDCISRQAAIETVRKCAVKEVTPAYMLIDKAEAMTELQAAFEALDMAIKALERQPCEDTISRQAAIDAADNMVEPQESEDKE